MKNRNISLRTVCGVEILLAAGLCFAGGADYTYNLAMVPIQPLTALKAGENTFSTVVGKRRMPDIYVPGVQILVRYKADGNGASPPPVEWERLPRPSG
jgi:hypothetical protein